MIYVELLQLHYFQVAAYHEHISRAAEELNISQPALSTMISRLERELGVELFDHSGRSISLNENGRLFLARVNRILNEVESSKQELQDIAQNTVSVIRLAASSPQFLRGIQNFIAEHPNYKWSQRVTDNKEIETLMRRGKIDLAITTPGIHGDDFESILLQRESFKVAVHKSHPLSRQKSVRLADLTDERFILLLKDLPFRTQTDQIFAEAGIYPRFIMECDHLLRRDLINAGVGITIASQSAAFRHLYNDEVCFLDIEDTTQTREIVMTLPKNRYVNKGTRQFAEYIRKKFTDSPFSQSKS